MRGRLILAIASLTEFIPTDASKDLDKFIRDMNGAEVEAGWFDDTYEKGQLIGFIAYIQEHGSVKKNIPPRPFMRPAASENEIKWSDIIVEVAEKVLSGELLMGEALDILGLEVSIDIQEAIEDVLSPKLADATLDNRKRRGNDSEKPLIDTGKMINSVDWRNNR